MITRNYSVSLITEGRLDQIYYGYKRSAHLQERHNLTKTKQIRITVVFILRPDENKECYSIQ
jgi:hypothetical protein